MNIPLENVMGYTSDATYDLVTRWMITPIARAFQPDLVLVSAGFDAAAGCFPVSLDVSVSVFVFVPESESGSGSGSVSVFVFVSVSESISGSVPVFAFVSVSESISGSVPVFGWSVSVSVRSAVFGTLKTVRSTQMSAGFAAVAGYFSA